MDLFIFFSSIFIEKQKIFKSTFRFFKRITLYKNYNMSKIYKFNRMASLVDYPI